MKIYFIGQKGIPARYGGVETHVENLAARLVEAGHEVFVYTRPNYTDKVLKEYRGINLISLPTINTKHLDAISHTFFACLDLARRDVDIVHFHSIGPSSLLWLAKIIKPNTPVIATYHCQDYYHQKWSWFARLYLKFGEWVCCNFSDLGITVSRNLQKFALLKHGAMMKYIPNGVEEVNGNISSGPITHWGLKRDGYILSVSRLVRHKGIHHLIEAYKNLKTEKKLVIVGDGSHTDEYVWELRSLANANPNIIFTGNQTDSTLKSLFSNASLFVQPSESEGMSISLLEAMSFGLPVLASDIPENREVIGDLGFTFKNRNTLDLKMKIMTLLNNPRLLAKSGRFNKQRVREYFNWQGITDQTIREYRRLNSNYGWKRSVILRLSRKFADSIL